MKINEKNLIHFVNCKSPVDREGWLFKKGEVNKSFQKRWFVLKGNLLFYFERKGDKEPAGLIILEGCTIELAENDDQFTFKIVFHGTGNRTYMLCADNQDNMEGWMKALACASYDYMKLMVAELERQLMEINELEQQKKREKRKQPNNMPRSQSASSINRRFVAHGSADQRLNPFSWIQEDGDLLSPQTPSTDLNRTSCENTGFVEDEEEAANAEDEDGKDAELEVFTHRQFAELHEYYGKQMRKFFDEHRSRMLSEMLRIGDS